MLPSSLADWLIHLLLPSSAIRGLGEVQRHNWLRIYGLPIASSAIDRGKANEACAEQQHGRWFGHRRWMPIGLLAGRRPLQAVWPFIVWEPSHD